MNINKKYIIIFGTLILLLVIIIGGITYYKEKDYKGKETQLQSPDVKQSVFSFSQDYPVNFEEFLDFINYCKDAVRFSDAAELKGKEIKEISCVLAEILPGYVDKYKNKYKIVNDKPYLPLFYCLNNIISFKPDRYIGISVDLKDVVRKYNPALLEQDKLSFCTLSEPSWTDPFYLQMEPKQDLIFDEGDVCCGTIKMGKTPFITISGFIPQAESLNIKQYLVDEQTVSDVMNKQSFSEVKDILENYPIIWQMEKPIVP